MSQPDETRPPGTDDAGTDAAADAAAADLVARAREACLDHPELADVLDRLDRLPEMDLAARPVELDAVHRVLREALANAGRPGPGA